MEWELHDTAVQPRVLIMVSKAGHCLNDLLYRQRVGALRIDVPRGVATTPTCAPLADVLRRAVPPRPGDTPASKPASEAALLDAGR